MSFAVFLMKGYKNKFHGKVLMVNNVLNSHRQFLSLQALKSTLILLLIDVITIYFVMTSETKENV